jgi:peptidoglycan/LPS O-acetylase OafA/YrhL
MPLAKEHFYIPCLDGIRALAVLLVIVAHSGFEKFVPGGLGVTVFFFLSGFLITTLLRMENARAGTISIRDFYLRRIFRIQPPMYVTIVIICLLAWLHVLDGPLKWKPIALTCLFFTNYIGIWGFGMPPEGLQNLWSLAVEEHFYLVFPLLYLVFITAKLKKRWQGLALASLCLLVLLWRIYLIYFEHKATGVFGRVYSYTDTRIDSILFGCLMAIVFNPLFDDAPESLRGNAGKLALLGFGLLGFSIFYRDELFRDTFRYSLQGIALLLIFFFVVEAPGRAQVRWLENPVLRYIGRRSYVLYLIHYAVAVELFLRLHWSATATLFATLGISLVYAEAMDHLIEAPMRTLKRRAMRTSFHTQVITPEDDAARREELPEPSPRTA